MKSLYLKEMRAKIVWRAAKRPSISGSLDLWTLFLTMSFVRTPHVGTEEKMPKGTSIYDVRAEGGRG